VSKEKRKRRRVGEEGKRVHFEKKGAQGRGHTRSSKKGVLALGIRHTYCCGRGALAAIRRA
jgi:hypothetical protein